MAPDSPVNAPYHHGDLRASALQMGMERLESQEQPDLGLRALARDLGVSATALYRHFPNKDALLDALALEGLTQLMKTVEMVRQSLNPALEIQGLVLTMYDRRSTLSGQVAADVRAHFGDKVYDAVIPRNVRVAEAPSFGKPALIYDLKCAGSQAYLQLAREVVARERQRRLQPA